MHLKRQRMPAGYLGCPCTSTYNGAQKVSAPFSKSHLNSLTLKGFFSNLRFFKNLRLIYIYK